MSRDSHIPVYTTETVKESIETQANAADKSVSAYCHEVLAEHVEETLDENQRARYGTDTDIELLLEELRSELIGMLDSFITETGAEIHHLQSLRTAYAIAIWELIKDDYSPAQREVALKTAGQHAKKHTPTQSSQQREAELRDRPDTDKMDTHQSSPATPSEDS